ncbi:hypothetical protein BSLG_009550 [Batrachochytrium salamandrivorans]|nr:hypothetical protein BSLG_009550 [Batrachochytrium salamandrivorans]
MDNGDTVLAEIERTSLGLEQTLFEADGKPHTDTVQCSTDARVIDLDAAFRRTLKAHHCIQIQQDLLTQLQRQQQREPVADMLEWFETNYAVELDKWEAMSDAVRLCGNEKYDGFRHALWEVRNPGVPFGQAASAAANEDEDVVMTTQTVSYKCPITLQIMVNPVTSRVCKHSFSDAIFQSFTSGVAFIVCPIAGCDKNIRAADLKPDAALKRKVTAWLREKRHELTEDDDCDEIVG